MDATLSWEERRYYRDRLRRARYSALADAEGFGEICFAIEAIGLRLRRHEGQFGSYINVIFQLAKDSGVLTYVAPLFPKLLPGFSAMYRTVQNARNDAMHSGVYARHATDAAIALCITLEEALMAEQQHVRVTVGDFMVRSPVTIEPWQPVAYARQLMLTHSFSFLPVKLNGGWMLLPEVSVAKFLHRRENKKELLAKEIQEVGGLLGSGCLLELIPNTPIPENTNVDELLRGVNASNQTLWLIEDGHSGLAGVLSPFELM